MATTKLNKEQKDPAYRRFVPDQVLTATQLNDVIDHFECQDRFTRICLNGVGIVCGLKVKYSKGKSVEVTKGCAVTTDGDLIPFSGATYTLAKAFLDVEAKYAHFNGVNLLELLPESEADKSGVEKLEDVANLNDMVVVLYLEYYCKAETPCTSTDCDTQGEGQTAKIRVLLISKEDAKRISNKDHDPIFDAHNNTKKFLNLPNVNLKKVVLKNSYISNANGLKTVSKNSNTASYFRLQDSYRKAIQDTSVISDLKDGVTKLFTDFNALLQADKVETKASTINKNIENLFKITAKNLPLDIQYRYDLLKDLIDTYNQIKDLLFDLRVVCCPNIASFPKHLLLGELQIEEAFLQYRHSFYPSPIIPHGKDRLTEIKTLILRMHFMLTEYKIPQSTRSEIKVTPSETPNKKLSNRAVPYYYETSPKLLENWDYNKSRKFKAVENLAYHTEHLSENDAIQNPLDYDLDDYNFHRIEGHLGKDYRNAIKELDAIKSDKGLAFDVKVLSIDETIESINTKDYECEFEDLNAVLKAWRAEQNCLNAGVSKFFSGFSLKNEGEHKFYKLSRFETANTDLSNEGNSRTTEDTASSGSTRFSGVGPLLSNPVVGAGNTTFFAGRTADFGHNLSMLTEGVNPQLLKLFGGQLTYNVDTVVLDNLEKDDDVLGSIVEKAMNEKPNGSAEDITALVKRDIDKNQDISNWDADNKEVTMYNASEILAYTKVASRYIPNDIAEIDTDRINNYESTIKALCSRVERFKKNMTTLLHTSRDNKVYSRHGFEEQYKLLLNQLSVNCCSAAKMKSLLAEIEARKRKILEQKLLSKFVEKHPGLEHKAGVKPGGTFIMVYRGGTLKSKGVNEAVLSSGISSNLELLGVNPNLSISGANIAHTNIGTNISNLGLHTNMGRFSGANPAISDRINPSFINPNILEALGDLLLDSPTSNIPENTVVADFCLPYMCCSDCSPIAFIVPKTTVSLRLPVDFVCTGEETKPHAFEVSPADGVVTADVENGMSGGVTQVDGKYVFDAKLVSEELYGKEIGFKVNDQFTDCKITVFEMPEFDFVASEPVYLKDNTLASVNFTVKGEKLPRGVSYEWDFGDDSVADNQTEENPKHLYELKLGNDGKQTFKVSLKITNGKCTHTVSHEVVMAPVVVDFKITNEICLPGNQRTNTNIPFEVSPDNAKVKLAQNIAKVEVKNNNVVIQPGFKAFNAPIKFTVNGKPVASNLTPRISPQVKITLPPRNKLVINAASTKLVVPFKVSNANGFDENSQTYKWSFGDGKTGSGKNVKHTYVAPRNATNGQVLTFNATLTVTSKTCGSKNFKTTVRIRVQRLI